jgi:hypothetical protein
MKPGDFPIGSPESRAAARMQLAHRHDNRKRVQFVANVWFPHPHEGGPKQDPARFHFGTWQECEDGSLFRMVYRPGGWLRPEESIPACPDCGALFEKENEYHGIVFYHASCWDLHDPDRAA